MNAISYSEDFSNSLPLWDFRSSNYVDELFLLSVNGCGFVHFKHREQGNGE